VSEDGDTVKTLESGVGPHTRYAGSQVSGGEKKYEERHNQELDRFYDEVIAHLGQAEAVLIFGPGEAKLQLEERIGRSKTLAARVVGVQAADRMTDRQIVAKVKEHYGLER
jgi:stalled ribosome rescue protein Dom34